MFSQSPPATIRPASTEELREWDSIVSGFPGARVFHSRAWVQSIEGFTKARGIYLVYEKHGRIVACFPGLVSRIGPLRMFCSPREGWQTESMGPVFDPQSVTTEEIISPLVSYLRRELRIHYLELASRSLDPNTMHQMGFFGSPLATYRADLPPFDVEEGMRRLESKARGHLRKAIKLGLRVHVGLTPSFVDEHLAQLALVFSRHGVALPFGRRRVDSFIQHLRETDVLLPVSVFLPDSQTCIATGLFLIANRELCLWEWAHRREFGSYSPIELLTWTAMQEAIRRGCTVFDLTGGGEAKKKFGAALDWSNTRWTYSGLPGLLAIRQAGKRAFLLWQKLRGGPLSSSRVVPAR